MPLVDIEDFYPYSFLPQHRYGYDKPPHVLLDRMFAKGLDEYQALVQEFAGYADDLRKISRQPSISDPSMPCWDNGWFPAMDGIALFGLISYLKPARYFEVGSGNSTKYAALAKRTNSPSTLIVSIDPAPRAEIESLCDFIIREPFQNVSAEFMARLMPGDILFIDGSHRVLQNSDVSVFYMEVLPLLKPGVLIGQHDIVLPYDYHADWGKRMYSEQYMLASVLLAAEEKFDIIFPTFYLSELHPERLRPVMDAVWSSPNLRGIPPFGSSFWMMKK
ncbi:MAG TPA: class I SAM-dependent methyltransferase [Candidatus Deferrimicrobiaceae bacterium]|jgi:hypothetical protein